MPTPKNHITGDLTDEPENRFPLVPVAPPPSLIVRMGEGEAGRIVLGLLVGLGFGGACALVDKLSGGRLMCLWMFATGWMVGWAMRLSVRKVTWELGLVSWRFGLSPVSVSLAICLFLDVCSGWFIHNEQTDTHQIAPLAALALFPAYWQLWHLFAYGLGAAAAYLNSCNRAPWKLRPSSSSRGTADRNRMRDRILSLLRLGPPILAVGGFVGLIAVVSNRTSIHELAVSPNGQFLAVVRRDFKGGIYVHDLSSGRTVQSRFDRADHIAWTPDRAQFAYLMNIPGSRDVSPLAVIHFVSLSGDSPAFPVREDHSTFHCMVFSPDGHTLAVGCSDGDILLWDLDHQQMLDQLAHENPVESLAYSPTTARLAAAYSDGQIALWDIKSRNPLRTWQAHAAKIHRLRFHPEKDILFSTAVGDDAARAWDPTSGEELHRYPLDVDWITDLAISPDGQTLAVSGGSFHRPGQVRLFAIDSGQLQRTFTVASNTVSTVAFTSDGTTLFAGTRPPLNPLARPRHGQIYRWDLSTGRELAPLQ